ncbi:hypothetical protein OH805_17645 [Streptomyces sp. NBC_00879]|uniref:hypothetical protein n=1 Tax=Streptomyces sp. NBC_00879 TaxID=2975855 RepID=UPI0038649A3B|nr:hypothetical protein OH805_17645 [Streptomyces sp. NBC_00879]
MNGYAKSPIAEAIGAAGSLRIRGIAAQTILLAFQLAHADRTKIKEWVETLALGGEPPREAHLAQAENEAAAQLNPHRLPRTDRLTISSGHTR